MSTREHTTVTAGPEVMVSGGTPTPAPPDLPGPPPSARRRALAIILVLAVVAAVAIAAAAAGVRAGGADDAVAEPRAQAPAAVPAAPAALQMSVTAPATARVGEPVRFTVTYSDGSGVLSGTSEDWADGNGASSVREGTCPAARAPGPLGDTYRVAHTFAAPGTYAVTLGVHTFSCNGSTPVQETATQTLTVEVLAR